MAVLRIELKTLNKTKVILGSLSYYSAYTILMVYLFESVLVFWMVELVLVEVQVVEKEAVLVVQVIVAGV